MVLHKLEMSFRVFLPGAGKSKSQSVLSVMGCSSRTAKPLSSKASESLLSVSIPPLWLSSLFGRPIHPINNQRSQLPLMLFRLGNASDWFWVIITNEAPVPRGSLHHLVEINWPNWERTACASRHPCRRAKSSLPLGFISTRFPSDQINYQHTHSADAVTDDRFHM